MTAPPARARTLRRADIALADIALAAVGFGVVGFGVAVRLWTWSTNRSLWLDEQMIAMNLRDRDVSRLAGQLDNQQSAPLGWLWAQRAVVELFGTGERALRLLPVLFGVATVLAAWLIGRRWLGAGGTVALTAFTAVNEALVNYSTQVKHYSADSFFVLTLLGLAGWVAEAPARTRRQVVWWATAVVGGWVSLGAIMAVTAFSVVLLGAVWWRRRWAAALRFCLAGLVWLAAFGAHYLLALRYTATGSAYMTEFWSRLGYPPRNLPGAARWLLERPTVLAREPLGLTAGIGEHRGPLLVLAALFWSLVLVGIVLAARRRPAFGLLLAAPVALAVLLAVVRVVPLVARLALWLVPVLFVAVACGLQAVAELATRVPALWRTAAPQDRARALAATVAVGAAGLVAASTVPAGTAAVAEAARTPATDDRAAIAWLRANHRQDDLLLAFGSATRAFQWYDHPHTLARRAVITAPTGTDCDNTALPAVTAGRRRVLAYFSARFVPYQHGSEVLAARLAELGRVEEHRLGSQSVIYVTDLRAPAGPPPRPVDLATIRYNCVRLL